MVCYNLVYVVIWWHIIVCSGLSRITNFLNTTIRLKLGALGDFGSQGDVFIWSLLLIQKFFKNPDWVRPVSRKEGQILRSITCVSEAMDKTSIHSFTHLFKNQHTEHLKYSRYIGHNWKPVQQGHVFSFHQSPLGGDHGL